MKYFSLALCLSIVSAACVNGGKTKTVANIPVQKVKVRKKTKVPSKASAEESYIVAGTFVNLPFYSSLDHIDKEFILRATQSALETAEAGQVKQWRNPNSGNQGSIKLTGVNEEEGTSVCRKLTHTIIIDGKTEEVTQRACRLADGTWIVRT